MVHGAACTLTPMATYGDRVAQGLALPGKTRQGLAAAVGISVQGVGQLLSGRSKQATAENNVAIAEYLECDPNWLATGRGVPGWGQTCSQQALVAREPAAPYGMPATARVLAQQLVDIDPLARCAIAPLISALALQPEDGARIVGMIEAVLASSAKQTGT